MRALVVGFAAVLAAVGFCERDPARAQDGASPPRFMLFGGGDVWHTGAFLHGGLVWSPQGLFSEGFTVKLLTGVGGLFEYARDGENCLLTPSGDAAAVAASTLRLLEDRELYERLSSEGVRTAQDFSHKLIAARHLETYRRWVRERKAGE